MSLICWAAVWITVIVACVVATTDHGTRCR